MIPLPQLSKCNRQQQATEQLLWSRQ
jgi:hypothetical protein